MGLVAMKKVFKCPKCGSDQVANTSGEGTFWQCLNCFFGSKNLEDFVEKRKRGSQAFIPVGKNDWMYLGPWLSEKRFLRLRNFSSLRGDSGKRDWLRSETIFIPWRPWDNVRSTASHQRPSKSFSLSFFEFYGFEEEETRIDIILSKDLDSETRNFRGPRLFSKMRCLTLKLSQRS